MLVMPSDDAKNPRRLHIRRPRPPVRALVGCSASARSTPAVAGRFHDGRQGAELRHCLLRVCDVALLTGPPRRCRQRASSTFGARAQSSARTPTSTSWTDDRFWTRTFPPTRRAPSCACPGAAERTWRCSWCARHARALRRTLFAPHKSLVGSHACVYRAASFAEIDASSASCEVRASAWAARRRRRRRRRRCLIRTPPRTLDRARPTRMTSSSSTRPRRARSCVRTTPRLADGVSCSKKNTPAFVRATAATAAEVAHTTAPCSRWPPRVWRGAGGAKRASGATASRLAARDAARDVAPNAVRFLRRGVETIRALAARRARKTRRRRICTWLFVHT